MGQNQSAHQIPEFIPSAMSHYFTEDSPVHTLISYEISKLTYEEFVATLGEINMLTSKYFDASERLIFAVKKGTDSNILWKATVQIACVKLNPDSKTVNSYRLLSLAEFLKVSNTLKCQYTANEQSKSQSEEVMFDSAKFSNSWDESDLSLCCICLERKHDTLLPCAHSYCKVCFDQWAMSNPTCPICRESVDNDDDTWVISEAPTSEEIKQEICSHLISLTTRKPDACSPS